MTRHHGAEGAEGLVRNRGPKRRVVWAQVCFFSCLSYFFTNIYIFTRHQAHGPTLATRASRWAVFTCHQAHGPHPCSKRESVGSPSTHMAYTAHPRCKRESVDRFCMTLDPRTPPSLQTRVGGVLSYILDHQNRPKRTPFGPMYFVYIFIYIL